MYLGGVGLSLFAAPRHWSESAESEMSEEGGESASSLARVVGCGTWLG